MDTNYGARKLALDLCGRSICKVQVAAVIADKRGIISWGWNHAIRDSLDGFGMHAEQHAFLRANRDRLKGSRLTVVAIRKKSGNIICSRPCEEMCLAIAKKNGVSIIEYTTKEWCWSVERL